MAAKNDGIINALIEKGVTLPNPETIEIGENVDPDRISGDGVVIHSGCRIFGKKTLILKGANLGYEAPVTVENCQIGPNVKLNGGFFKQSVFLNHASVGSGAHVREGTIFEEYASAAHCVGVKQTILFPYVTLGSQINFCDCFMAGGTGKKNHSEVGSSYIHFNFTPQQDKATPSLIGDVPKGVMLDQAPIFLGGQGGLVGPCRLAYGITIAAGTIFRKNELRENRLIFGGAAKSGNIAFTPGVYSNAKRIFHNNIHYIANLLALRHWYQHIRLYFISDEFPEELYDGVMDKLDMALTERIKRLEDFLKKLEKYTIQSSEQRKNQSQKYAMHWPELKHMLNSYQKEAGDDQMKAHFIGIIRKNTDPNHRNYIESIMNLSSEDKQAGTAWLQGIVDQVVNDIMTKAES